MKPNFGDQFESFLRERTSVEIIETVKNKINTLNGIVLEDDSLGEVLRWDTVTSAHLIQETIRSR